MVHKHKNKFILLLLPIYIFFVPIGFDSFNRIDPKIDVDSLGTEEGLSSFTSLRDEVVFVINGDDDIISTQGWDWIAEFAFELQTNPIVQQFGHDPVNVQHIFQHASGLLSTYFTTLYLAIGAINVTSYFIIEGTQLFLSSWQNAYQENSSISPSQVTSSVIETIRNQTEQLSFVDLYDSIANFWISNIVDYFNNANPLDLSYADIASNWTGSPLLWTPNINNELIQQKFPTFLTMLNATVDWNKDDIFPVISELIFSEIEEESLLFLDHLFNDGNDPSRATQLARNNLFDFINSEYLPYGFPEEIRTFLLTAFTNSDGTSKPTALILTLGLRSNLTTPEISTLFTELERIATERDSNDYGYEVSMLSFLNYERERGDALSKEMHRADLITIVVALAILIFWLREPILAIIITSLSWLTTQVSKGIIIKSQAIFGATSSIAFSMTTSMLLGAGLNYVVFFAYRYHEAKRDGKGYEEVIVEATETALHSVVISGFTVFLAMSPYLTSSFEILVSFSKAFLVGMFFQILILFLALPTVFSFVNNIQKYLRFDHVPKVYDKIIVKRSNVKKILVTAISLGVISLIIILFLNSTLVVGDLIGDDGQTGKSKRIIQNEFPPNYFSKTLVSTQLESSIYSSIEGLFNQTIMQELDILTSKLNLSDVQTIVSPAWPLGTPYDFTNESVSLIEKTSAETAAKELITNNGMIAYIVIQLKSSANSDQAYETTELMIEIIENHSSPSIKDISASGFLVESLDVTNKVSNELPKQIILAVILICLFLWWQLGSLTVPLRLEFSIILANLYAIAISGFLINIFLGSTMNILIITLTFAILLGLGTDFDIYIYRRILEEYEKTDDYYEAIIKAIKSSGPAVQTSGLVMACTLATLLTSSTNLLRQFGLVSFITIMIDIFFIRLVVVPAILLFLNPEVTSDQ